MKLRDRYIYIYYSFSSENKHSKLNCKMTPTSQKYLNQAKPGPKESLICVRIATWKRIKQHDAPYLQYSRFKTSGLGLVFELENPSHEKHVFVLTVEAPQNRPLLQGGCG